MRVRWGPVTLLPAIALCRAGRHTDCPLIRSRTPVAFSNTLVSGGRRNLPLTLVEIESCIQFCLPDQQFLEPHFVLKRQEVVYFLSAPVVYFYSALDKMSGAELKELYPHDLHQRGALRFHMQLKVFGIGFKAGHQR